MILVAVIFGAIGYIIGGITIGLRVEKYTQLASLVRINGMHEMLERQRYEEARKMSIKAEQANLDFLNTLNNTKGTCYQNKVRRKIVKTYRIRINLRLILLAIQIK